MAILEKGISSNIVSRCQMRDIQINLFEGKENSWVVLCTRWVTSKLTLMLSVYVLYKCGGTDIANHWHLHLKAKNMGPNWLISLKI